MLRRLALAALLALAPSLACAQFATIAPTPAVTDNGDRVATTAWVNNFFATGLPLASGKIIIGSVGGIGTPQTMSGDCTLIASGVVTCTQAAGNFNVIGNISKGGVVIPQTVSAPLTLSGAGLLACPACVLISGTAHGDSAYSILSTDRYVYTNAAFTLPRTWTLPAANSLPVGTTIWVQDAQGTVTTTNTLTISRAGADTIDVANTSLVITGAGGGITFTTDGVSNWGTPFQTVTTGGTGRATLTNHGVLVGAGTSPITQLAVASTGTVLRGATGADPAFGAVNMATDMTGTMLAAQEPARTGDCTNSAGSLALACTGINGVNQNAAWTTYTPTPSCGTGTFTSASATGRYKQIGKTIFVEAFLIVTTNGTCAGSMRVSTPITAAANYYAMSVFDTTSGATGSAAIANIDGTAIRIFTTAGAYPTGFNPVVTGVYEIP